MCSGALRRASFSTPVRRFGVGLRRFARRLRRLGPGLRRLAVEPRRLGPAPHRFRPEPRRFAAHVSLRDRPSERTRELPGRTGHIPMHTLSHNDQH